MKQIVLKLLMLGDGGVGKTTLLHRYVKRIFLDSTTMTIGVEFLTKQIMLDSLVCQLVLWDITGQQRFRHLIEQYMKGASGALILFDITNMTSFVNIGKWMSLVRKYYERLPVILIAAKCDLEEFSMVGDLYAKKTQKRFEMIDHVKTSSKTGLNVDLAFETITKYVLKSKNLI
ncbi:MAG: GTP-binding protein [Promethearchaeota archaeon]